MTTKFVNKVTPGYRWSMMFVCGILFYTCCQLAWMFYGFYNLIQEVFGATGTEMGLIGTVTGVAMIFCWPIGGMIADKMSMRMAFIASGFLTTGFYIVFAFVTNFYVFLILILCSCLLVGALYGLAFKLVKRLSTPDNENKGYGFLISFYAITGSVLGFSGAYLVAQYGISGWKPLMFMFAGISLVTSIVGYFCIKEERLNDWSQIENTGEEVSKFQFSHVKKVLLMPELWVAGFIYHTMLLATAGGIYAVSMLGDIYNVPLYLITAIGVVRAYLARSVLSPITGVILDKTRDSIRLIRILVTVAFAAIVLFFLFPMTDDYMWVGIVLVLAMTVAYGMQSPLWLTPINDLRIPLAYHGTAIGVYNAIGSLSDAYVYLVIGYLLDNYGTYEGNRYAFAFIGVMMAICFVLTLICSKMIKKRNAMLDAQALGQTAE